MRYWAPATYPVIDLYLADSATAVLFLGCSLSTLYCSPFFPSLFLPPPSFLPLPSSPLTLFFSTPLPSLFALHPSPLPLHHSFFTLHYSPFALHPLSFTLQPSLFNLHPLFLTLHSTFHSSFFTLHPLPLTFHSLLFTLYPSPLTFDSSLFTIHSSLFSLHHPPPFTLHPSLLHLPPFTIHHSSPVILHSVLFLRGDDILSASHLSSYWHFPTGLTIADLATAGTALGLPFPPFCLAYRDNT